MQHGNTLRLHEEYLPIILYHIHAILYAIYRLPFNSRLFFTNESDALVYISDKFRYTFLGVFHITIRNLYHFLDLHHDYYQKKYRYLRRVTINETNFLTDATIFYDLEQLVDQGQFEEVYILAKKIYQEREDMVTPYRQEILRLLLFAASLQHPEDPLITSLLEDPLLVAMLKTKRPENSTALGFGFRCGFLGLLHMEIIQERLEREYDLDLITTAPTVIYEVEMTSGEVVYVDSPAKLPPLNNISEIREPIAECNMLVPQEFLGNVITLCVEKRGVQTNMVYHGNQIALTYEIPMGEVVLDFFDRLKSTSRGYASLDYGFKRFQAADMVRVDIMINGDRVDALALIVHKDNAPYRGRELVEKMRELIPRQQFDIAIQAAIGNHIIARSTVKQLRKNVLAKCYGGDVSRKKKLLQKQKEGKKRMKSLGNVEVPQEAFLAILHVGKDK